MQLELPSIKYKESYLEAVQEFQGEGRYLDIEIETLRDNFSNYIQKFKDESEGKNLKDGYVPQTVFWAVDNDEYIGRISVRHYLNENLEIMGGHIGYDVRPSKRKLGYGGKMLALVLPKAKELGIKKALITCDSNNIPSKKIIEKNGGIFDGEVFAGEGKPNKLRYWIEL